MGQPDSGQIRSEIGRKRVAPAQFVRRQKVEVHAQLRRRDGLHRTGTEGRALEDEPPA